MEHADETPARLVTLPTWLLSRANALAHRRLADAFAAEGVRGYHYRLLAVLEEFGPASQATLGRQAGLDRSDVVAVVTDLARLELIERRRDPDDGRRNIITITRMGRERLRGLDAIVARVQDDVLQRLSGGERRQLVGLLSKLTTGS